ncbi:MAG TPA: uracil-DNA glycosylase family protein [Gemmatimonadaceae bacterium]|nr:uracil-DNA glycosylase family protein [Gemmatimonadaceae bacterium]
MDAKELLRRYLEQRREMGESELVLDTLTVEEVMRLIGAGRSSKRGAVPEIPRARQAVPDVAPAPDDWRAVLESSGVSRPDPATRRIDRAPPDPATLDDAPADVAPPKPKRSTPALPFTMPPTGIIVGSGETELFGGPISQVDSIGALARMVHECRRCPLFESATQGVPGEGNPNADLMCIGEAPGATEDATGRPFVGQAGQLLTKILSAINLSREDVFICNVLKHRPPGNRNPRPEEVEACVPYLVRQVELIRPKVIVAFGTFAAQTLLNTTQGIGKLRGLLHRYHGIPVIVTYHPAALLRNPNWKRPTWEDVQLARRILDNAAA